MLFTDRLYENAKEIWESYFTHPFLRQLGEGTLPVDTFRYFMIQDYLYLLEYSKVFALGVVKAQDEETLRLFAGLVHDTLYGEMEIHKSYMDRLAITQEQIAQAKPSLENVSYTSYMLWQAQRLGIEAVAVSVLACSWSYEQIGDFIRRQYPQAVYHPIFGQWVQGYISEEYKRSNQIILDLTNQLCSGGTAAQEEAYMQIFVDCSRYEALFWDMAYRGGKS